MPPSETTLLTTVEPSIAPAPTIAHGESSSDAAGGPVARRCCQESVHITSRNGWAANGECRPSSPNCFNCILSTSLEASRTGYGGVMGQFGCPMVRYENVTDNKVRLNTGCFCCHGSLTRYRVARRCPDLMNNPPLTMFLRIVFAASRPTVSSCRHSRFAMPPCVWA